jgi:hypothetical protein
MRKKNEDKDTRYFVDLDLRTRTVIGWDYDQRTRIVMQNPAKPYHHRLFITKGQYNKLEQRSREVEGDKLAREALAEYHAGQTEELDPDRL